MGAVVACQHAHLAFLVNVGLHVPIQSTVRQQCKNIIIYLQLMHTAIHYIRKHWPQFAWGEVTSCCLTSNRKEVIAIIPQTEAASQTDRQRVGGRRNETKCGGVDRGVGAIDIWQTTVEDINGRKAVRANEWAAEPVADDRLSAAITRDRYIGQSSLHSSPLNST